MSNTADKRQAYRESVSKAVATITVTPRRPGRPTRYTPELGELLCDRLIEAGGLPEACRRFDDLPDEVSVYRWTFAYEDFGKRIARAREILCERWADQIRSIAEDGSLEPNDRRVRIDTLKWLISKNAPRRFGDTLKVSGDPENPIEVLHKHASLDALSTVQLQVIEQFARGMLEAQDAEAIEIDAK